MIPETHLLLKLLMAVANLFFFLEATTHIPIEERIAIIEMSKARVLQRKSAKKMSRSFRTVNRICQAFAQEGRLHDAPCLTSSRTTMPEVGLLIVGACLANP